MFFRQRQRTQKGGGLRDQLGESAYSLSRSTPAPVSWPSWSPTSRQLFFALEVRQAGNVVAVEFEKVEGELGEPFTGLLHQFE